MGEGDNNGPLDEVEFYEPDNEVEQRRLNSVSAVKSRLEELLIKKGYAKTNTQAKLILVGISFLILALSIVFFTVGFLRFQVSNEERAESPIDLPR